MEGNLTKGPILKTLTKLAIPIMASSFLGTLYNLTDMAWIGLLGSKAVAGVGVGGMFKKRNLTRVRTLIRIIHMRVRRHRNRSLKTWLAML